MDEQTPTYTADNSVNVPTLYTVDQVCQMLEVTPDWLYRQVREGNIKHLRLGSRKLIRFRVEHIEEYLDDKRQTNERVAP